MKAKRLIMELEKLVNEHGDLQVHLWSDSCEEAELIGGVSVSMDDQDRALDFAICGENTFDLYEDFRE